MSVEMMALIGLALFVGIMFLSGFSQRADVNKKLEIYERSIEDLHYQVHEINKALHEMTREERFNEDEAKTKITELSEAEIELLAATQTKLCLCPGSNRFLGVGKAPVKHYLEHGILPALGTDSLASNPEVSIWREMQLLSEDHPEIDHHAILAMATQGGALALGVANDYGTLSPGKKADILAVQLPSIPWTTKKILAYLVQTGSRIRPTRILGA